MEYITKKQEAASTRDIRTPVSIRAAFVVAKYGISSSATDEWIKKKCGLNTQWSFTQP
jgi:hypothetical protein